MAFEFIGANKIRRLEAAYSLFSVLRRGHPGLFFKHGIKGRLGEIAHLLCDLFDGYLVGIFKDGLCSFDSILCSKLIEAFIQMAIEELGEMMRR